MANNTQQFRLEFSAGINSESFKQLEAQLKKIEELYSRTNEKKDPVLKQQLQVAVEEAKKLQSALQAAYNVKLGTFNMDVVNQKLKESNTSLQQINTDFQTIGVTGAKAFAQVANTLTSTNLELKKTESIFEKMGDAFLRTVGWTVASTVIHNITGSIQESYGYVKALDSALNDIRIVTYKSAEEMDVFAEKANKAAIALGKGTKDYAQASLIYYQQGLSDEETAARAEVTVKAANVTQQSTAEVSEQLTAVWNGYKVSADEAELYVDKLAAVAATTAADLEELSTGMSKVASAANTVGVSVDQMNAILATTVSVTKQSPESVGVAYKTILARMTSISAGEETEDGATLASYTEKMYGFGINVLDANNKLRDMGEVIEEIGGKWATMSREQQIALAQVMAGTRQYNNLIALFDNWGMYEDALKTSAEAAGTLNKQQEIYMDSAEAHLQQMRTAAEGVYDSLLKSENIKAIVDELTKMLQLIEKMVDGFGGLKGILTSLTPLLTGLFSKSIANNVNQLYNNLVTIPKLNQQKVQSVINNIDDNAWKTITDNPGISQSFKTKEELLSQSKFMTTEELQAILKPLDEYSSLMATVNAEIVSAKNSAKDLNDELSHFTNISAIDANTEDFIEFSDSIEKTVQDLEKYQNEVNKINQFVLAENKNGTIIQNPAVMWGFDQSNPQLATRGAQLQNEVYTNFDPVEIISKHSKYKNVTSNSQQINILARQFQQEFTQAFTDGLESGKAGEQAFAKSASSFIQKFMTALKDKSGPNLSSQAAKKIGQDIQNSILESITSQSFKGNDKFQELLVNDITKDAAVGIQDAYKQMIQDVIDNGDMDAAMTTYNEKIKEIFAAKDLPDDLKKKVQALADDTSKLGPAAEQVDKLKLSFADAVNNSSAVLTQTSRQISSLVSLGTNLSGIIKNVKAFMSSTATLEERESAIAALLPQIGAAAMSAAMAMQAFGIQADVAAAGMIKLSVAGKTLSLSFAPLAIITAAIAALGIAYSAIKSSLENTAKAAADNAQKLKETAEASKEAANNAINLREEYEKLEEQYKDGSITIEELRIQTRNLAESYGEEEIAVRSLYASYSDLNRIMKENEETKANLAIEDAYAYANAAGVSVDASLENWKWDAKNIGGAILGTIFSGTPVGAITTNIDLVEHGIAKTMSSDSLANRFESDLVAITGTSDLDRLTDEKIADYYIQLQRLAKKYQSEMTTTTDIVAQGLWKDLLQQFNRLPEDVKSKIEEKYNADLAVKDLRTDLELKTYDISSIDEKNYEEKRAALIQSIQNIYGDTKTQEEIEKIISNFFINIAETSKSEYIHALGSKFNVSSQYKEGLMSAAQGLNENELNFLMQHPILTQDLVTEGIAQGLTSQEIMDSLKQTVDDYLPKYQSELNQIQTMLQDPNLSASSIYKIDNSLRREFERDTENSFEKAYQSGIEGAQSYLLQFYSWLSEKSKNQKLIDTDNLEEQIEQIMNKIDEQEQGFFNINSKHTQISRSSLSQFNTYDDFKAALESENGVTLRNTAGSATIFKNGDFNTVELEVIQKYFEERNKNQEELNGLSNEYNQILEENEEIQNRINNATRDALDLSEQWVDSQLSSGDKDSQKAWKVIEAARKEWDQNGGLSGLSADTLASLRELDPVYKQFITDANGELDLTKTNYEEIVKAARHEVTALAEKNVQQEEFLLKQTKEELHNFNLETQNRALTKEESKRLAILQDELWIREESLKTAKADYDWAQKQENAPIKDYSQTTKSKTSYYKAKEYEEDRPTTKYIDEEIKRKQQELKYLEEDAKYLTGEDLQKNLDERIKKEEEINQLYDDRIAKNKEIQSQAKQEIEAYAAAHNIVLKYNEDGTLSRESIEAIEKAQEVAERAAIDAENAAGQAKASAESDDSGILSEAYSKAQENASAVKKQGTNISKSISEYQSSYGNIQADERAKKEGARTAYLDKANKLYAELDDRMAKATLEYKKQDAEIEKIQKDLDSLSPEEQMDKLGIIKILQEKRKESLEKDLQDYQNAINEGLKGIDLSGTGIDISNIKGMSPEEIDVTIDQMERLANTFALTEPEKYAALTAAAEELKKCKDVAKEYQEQADKTKVSQKELMEAMNSAELEGVSNGLSKIERELKKVKAAQSGLKGKELIANLQKQQALMQKQLSLEKQKLAIQAKQVKAQADTLQGMLAQVGIQTQIKFNEDGSLANHYELIQAILTEVSLSEEERDYLKEWVELLAKAGDELAKTTTSMEDLQTDIDKLAKDIADKTKEATKKAMEEALKRFNAKVDVELNIEDAWRNLHKLRAELDGLKDNDYFGKVNLGLKQFNEYLRENPNSLLAGGSTQILTNHLNEIMGHINTIQSGGTSSIYGKGREAEEKAFSDLQKYRDELASNVENGLNAIKEIRENYLSAIDAFISKNNELKSSLEQINSLAKNMEETLKLIYGDEAYDKIGKYLAQETKGYKVLLESARANAEMAKQRMKTAPNQEAWEKWAAAYKTYSADVWKYQQELIKAAKAEFENTLNEEKAKTIAAYKAVYDETSKLPLNMRWDLEKENAQEYIDYTNSLYETSKLNRKFNDAIDNADTKHAQETLKKVQQEQMSYLDSQIAKNKQLTKYEVDRANAVYELTLRQIALEEAQNNKSTMRLRRDSQGNYRYEYVADQDKINDAMQKLEDAQNKLYNLDKEYTMKYTEMFETKITEFWDNVKEIDDNANLTEEERQAALQELWERYWGDAGIITQVREQAEWGYQNLLQTSADKQSSLLDAVKDHFNVSYDEMKTKAAESLATVDEKYRETQGVIEETGGTVEALSAQYDDHNETMQTIVETESQIVDGLNAQIDAIEALLPELEAMAEAWKAIAEQALGAIEAELMYREKLKAEEEEEAQETKQFGADNLVTAIYGTDSSNSGAKVQTWTRGINPISGGHTREWDASESGNGYGINVRKKTQKETAADMIPSWLRKIVGLSSGGYTGDWGADGKLAVLHEKELVLNAADTKNILSAVEIMRTLMTGMSNTYSSTLQSAVPAFTAANGTLDQNVHIEANFPNVQNANEIEEAFNNLINLASQQINSNLK